MRPGGGFVCIEIKSDLADFRADRKWHHYRDYADALYFAVDVDFPTPVLPADTGLIVTTETEAALIREAPEHRLASARRRALTQSFARLAAMRLAVLEDPIGVAQLAAALRSE